MIKKEDGIISILVGGLGNNLFNIATALIASKKLNNCPIYLHEYKVEENKHNKLLHNYNELLFYDIAKEIKDEEKDYFNKNYKEFEHGMSKGLLKYDVNKIEKKMILYSYFQYYPPIGKNENYIRDIINEKCLKKYRKKVQNDLCDYNLNNCIFLHIRRGDYLEYSDVYYIPSIENYYKKCCDAIFEGENEIEKIFILSNDIEFVKNEKYFSSNNKFIIYENDNEIEALSLMTLCSKGSICSNSTFSWWGAFLGSYQYRNDVYVPKEWIKLYFDELFPKEWKKI